MNLLVVDATGRSFTNSWFGIHFFYSKASTPNNKLKVLICPKLPHPPPLLWVPYQRLPESSPLRRIGHMKYRKRQQMDHHFLKFCRKECDIMFYLIFLEKELEILFYDWILPWKLIQFWRGCCVHLPSWTVRQWICHIFYFYFGLGLGGGFKSFYFHHMLGNWSNLTNIYPMGSNHQLVAYLYIYIDIYIYKYICVNTHHIFLYTFGQILRNPILRHPPVFCVSPTKNRQNATSSVLSQGDGGCHERHCRVGSKAGQWHESQGMLGFQQQEKHHENRGYIHPQIVHFLIGFFPCFFFESILGFFPLFSATPVYTLTETKSKSTPEKWMVGRWNFLFGGKKQPIFRCELLGSGSVILLREEILLTSWVW